jgi:PAS domain S-box-containing protein
MIVGEAKTILLVEDEAIIALSEKMMLEEYGYHVVTAKTGEEAVEFVRTLDAFDLILMDIDLGRGIDGPEAAKRILQDCSIPIVFLSSHTEPAIVERTESITSYGYVVKSSSITVLDASIKMAFKLFAANKRTQSTMNKLEATLDAFPDLLFELGLDGRYYDCHSPRSELLYVPIADFIGKYVPDILPPEAADVIMSAIREAHEKGISAGGQYELMVPAGARWFEVSASRMADAPDQPHFIMLCSDITERKQLERQYIIESEMFQKVLDSIPQFICWKNRKSEFLGCNKNHADLFGLADTKSIIGKTDWDLHRGQGEIEHFIEDDRIVMESDRPKYHIIEKAAYPDGKLRWLDTNKIPLHDVAGEVSGILITYSDITEKKRTEEALSLERYLLQTLMDTTPDHIYFKDRESRFIRASRSQCGMFGLGDASEIIGKTDFDFFSHEHAQQAFDDEQAIIRNGELLRKEERETWRYDPDTWVYSIKLPLRDKEGSIIGTFGISRDISEIKSTEERIESLLKEKDLILKEVHHRIKNNMNTISSLLRIQASRLKQSEAVEALEDAASRVQSMLVLYDQLYQSSNFSGLSVKKYFPALVDQIMDNFPDSNFIATEMELEDFVLGAKTLQPLGIIINELITNIFKYAFKGRSEGHIRIKAFERDGIVTLIIQDDGNGIPEGIDFDNSKGFGLMLVGMLTRQLDGNIRIERGLGTRILLEFENDGCV